MTPYEKSILRWLTVLIVPVVTGLALFVSVLWRDYTDSDVWQNGYIAPKYLYSLIEQTKLATVKVECESNIGSGFSFEFEEADQASFNFEWSNKEASSIILTNNHVIEECAKNNSSVYVQDSESRQLKGQILEFDSKNDIAAIWVPKKVPSLKATWYFYRPGYWAMAMGSPFGMTGTVTFGNIIYSEGNKIYTSASLNKGNSGGPLVDNTGLVMAINSGYKAVAQNLNYAIDINALCEKLAECKSEIKLIHPNIDTSTD